MRTEMHLVSKLPESMQIELKSRVDREFGSVPIVREHVWAEPTWAFLGFVDDQLVSFLNVVDRQVLADSETRHFFGLNNVITDPQHRGKGYSKVLNRNVIEFMSESDPNACGFLFCANDLIPFYTDLGWKKFEGEVIVSQPSGDKRWQSNAMFYDFSGSHSQSQSWKTVHLCGLPW
jgi:GNAT superfamily N-acetyltransferase